MVVVVVGAAVVVAVVVVVGGGGVMWDFYICVCVCACVRACVCACVCGVRGIQQVVYIYMLLLDFYAYIFVVKRDVLSLVLEISCLQKWPLLLLFVSLQL